jgi:hypothetical protein
VPWKDQLEEHRCGESLGGGEDVRGGRGLFSVRKFWRACLMCLIVLRWSWGLSGPRRISERMLSAPLCLLARVAGLLAHGPAWSR